MTYYINNYNLKNNLAVLGGWLVSCFVVVCCVDLSGKPRDKINIITTTITTIDNNHYELFKLNCK